MNEGVVIALHVVARAYPAVALVSDLEDALDRTEALGSRRGLVDGLDELALADARILDSELRRLGAKVGDLELGELLAGHGGLCGEVLLVTPTTATLLAVLATRLALCLSGSGGGGSRPGSLGPAMPPRGTGGVRLLRRRLLRTLGERLHGSGGGL